MTAFEENDVCQCPCGCGFHTRDNGPIGVDGLCYCCSNSSSHEVIPFDVVPLCEQIRRHEAIAAYLRTLVR